jgi:hypothetical protein
MSKKLVWIVVVVVVLVGGRFVLEGVAGNMLDTANLMVEQERYDAAERKLDTIDRWFSWTDVGEATARTRIAIDERKAAELQRAEAMRQQRAFEEAQAQWRAQQQAEGGRQAEGGDKPPGVHHGLNKAEKLRR